MSPTPRHHAAPMGLAAVLFGFACYKHAAAYGAGGFGRPDGDLAALWSSSQL